MINAELKECKNIEVINDDVPYQEGIFEILENNKKIDFIILSQLIPGNYCLDELIEKIEEINSEIKILLILEKYDEKLEKILIKKGVYRIFYDNKIEIKDILKIINEDDKLEKYNEEIRREIDELKEYIKNNKKNENKLLKKEKNNYLIINKNNIINKFNLIKKINIIKNKLNIIFNLKNNNIISNLIIKNPQKNNNKKIISILGNNGAGKSIFSVLLSKSFEKYFNRILIIDFDILNNSLHTILGVKKYSEKIRKILNENNYINEKINIENLIIKINKKIDLISGINLIFNEKNKINEEKIKNIIKEISDNYDVIIIDTTSECFFEYTKQIIKISDESIFLTEANLLELSKTKRFLEIYDKWGIEKNKIKIIFNKFNKNSIDFNLIKKLYSGYQILGYIKLKNKYSSLINQNINSFDKKEKIINKYDIFSKKLIYKY